MTSREKFEDWYAQGDKECLSIRRVGDRYCLMQTHQAWKVWQAAYDASALKHVEGLVEALDNIKLSCEVKGSKSAARVRFNHMIATKALAAIPKDLGGSDV